MKPIFQTIMEGELANCQQAVIASIFELRLDSVPNFAATPDHNHALTMFLRPFNLYPLFIEAGNQLIELQGYYEIAVLSPRGRLHSLVGLNGERVHDPYPGGKCEGELRFYTIFVCINPGKQGQEAFYYR